MSKQRNSDLFEKFKLDLEIIESCETIGGALKHLSNFFENIKTHTKANQIIWLLQRQLHEQKQIAFETLQKAVYWIHEKLHLMKKIWKGDSAFLKRIDRALEFNLINLGSGSYFSMLFNEFNLLIDAIVKNPEYHLIFDKWAEIKRLQPKKYGILKSENTETLNLFPVVYGDFYISKFIFPECVEKELGNLSMLSNRKEIYSWKEKVDFSLIELFKFLTMLAQYDSFVPLKLDTANWIPPKSLQEVENKQYQAYVGYYLSLFKSSDVSKHPLSIGELIKLVKHFVLMLDKKISDPTMKGPALKKKKSEAAKEYCIEKLVAHVKDLSKENLKEFRKWRYKIEVFEFLLQKAKDDCFPFIEVITPTMVQEAAGPQANRYLLKRYKIIWHMNPQK